MRDVIPHGQDTPPNLVVLDAMIRHALHATGEQLTRQSIFWNRLPHLHTHHRADVEACRLFGTGTKGLAFAKTVRTTLTEHGIDGLKPGKSGGDETVLHVPLNDQFVLRLIFDRSPQFYGHGFTLMLAFEPLVGPCARCVWRDYSALALLGSAGLRPVWIFETKLDLEESIAGVATLLRAMLPPLRAAFAAHVEPAALQLPSTIDDRTGMTARQAFDLASPLAVGWNGQPRLESIFCRDALNIRAGGPQLISVDPRGRLTPTGLWDLTFWSATTPDRFTASVPALGPITFGAWEIGINTDRFSERLSIPENWIDSDRAMEALAPFLGGEQAIRAATFVDMKLRVDQFRGDITGPRWGVRLHLNHGQDRPAALCDAISGVPATPLAGGNW